MNRRELAKNGFLALCGAFLGKSVKEPESEVTITCGTSFDGTYHICHAAGSMDIAGIALEDFRPVPGHDRLWHGWVQVADPEEDIYNG